MSVPAVGDPYVAPALQIMAQLATALASPGGQSFLEKLFVEHGLTLDALVTKIASRESTPDPRP